MRRHIPGWKKSAQASTSRLRGALFQEKRCGPERTGRSAAPHNTNVGTSSTFHSCRQECGKCIVFFYSFIYIYLCIYIAKHLSLSPSQTYFLAQSATFFLYLIQAMLILHRGLSEKQTLLFLIFFFFWIKPFFRKQPRCVHQTQLAHCLVFFFTSANNEPSAEMSPKLTSLPECVSLFFYCTKLNVV